MASGKRNATRRQSSPRQQILDAFSTAPAPPDVLTDFDDPRDPERGRILRDFHGKRWQDIPLEVLCDHAQSLFFFTPEAFRYYLPAYMLACAGPYHRAGNIPHTLVGALTPPRPEGPDAERFRATMGRLSPSQRSAVRALLEHMIAKHGEDDPLHDWERALRRFWREAGGAGGRALR